MNQTCPSCGSDTQGRAACLSCGAELVVADVVSAASPAPVAMAGVEPVGTRKGRKGLALGVGALALSVGAAGALAWSVLGQDGGAATPEAAADQFFTSLAAQDVVGVIDTLVPGEVEGLAEAWETGRDEAVDKGEIAPEGVTSAVTVTGENWEFDVDQVDARVALVTLADTDVKVEWDLDKIEADDVKDDLDELDIDEADRKGVWPNESAGDFSDLTDAMAQEGMTPTLVTVEEDGRWYVSLLGTTQNVLFQAIHSADGDPDFHPDTLDWATVGRGHDAIVGEDSREVVEQILTAVEEADVESALALMPQSQVRALWASWGHVVDAAEEEFGAGATGLSLELKDWETVETDLGDDFVKVGVKSAEFLVSYEDASFDPNDGFDRDDSFVGTLLFEDGCFTASTQGEDDAATGCLDQVDLGRDVFADDLVTVVMRSVDGGMQVDPLATLSHYVTTIDEERVEEQIETFFADLGMEEPSEAEPMPDFVDENGELDEEAFDAWLAEQDAEVSGL